METGHSPEYLSHKNFFLDFRALNKRISKIHFVTEALMGHVSLRIQSYSFNSAQFWTALDPL
jgi:hypothetical protein